jgi:WD40 repeat protein
VHASCFCRVGSVSFILAGDEEGRISVTALQDRRPRYFWRAHEKSILSVNLVQIDEQPCLLSQGRDNKLHIWKLSEQHALPSLSVLPSRIQQDLPVPDVVRSTDINALNYCPISLLSSSNVLAVTHTIDSGYVDVLQIPSFDRLLRSIGKPDMQTNGQRAPMCMTLHLLQCTPTTLLAGYEDGFMRMWSHESTDQSSQLVWAKREHSESIMASALTKKFAVSVAADNKIVRYDLIDGSINCVTCNSMGNASVTIRQDGQMLAVGGWDGKIRLYSPDLQHLASLRYHKDTVQALDFLHPREVLLVDSSDDSDDEEGSLTSSCNLVSGGKEGRLCLWAV